MNSIRSMDYHNLLIKALVETEITNLKGDAFESYDQGFQKIMEILFEYKASRRAVYVCGNGGSAGIAQHMTADLLKNGGIKALSLFNQPTLTCLANDLGYEQVYARQLELYADHESLLIAISSSGNSVNILAAVDEMRRNGGAVITLSGFRTDNKLRKTGDYNIYVPIEHYGIVESIHTILLQQMVDTIVERDGVAMRTVAK